MCCIFIDLINNHIYLIKIRLCIRPLKIHTKSMSQYITSIWFLLSFKVIRKIFCFFFNIVDSNWGWSILIVYIIIKSWRWWIVSIIIYMSQYGLILIMYNKFKFFFFFSKSTILLINTSKKLSIKAHHTCKQCLSIRMSKWIHLPTNRWNIVKFL